MARTGHHSWLHPGWKIPPKKKATAQTPTVSTISGVRIRTLLYTRTTSLLSLAAGGALSLIIVGEVARHSSCAIELLALCLNSNNNIERVYGGEVLNGGKQLITAHFSQFTIGKPAIVQALVNGTVCG